MTLQILYLCCSQDRAPTRRRESSRRLEKTDPLSRKSYRASTAYCCHSR